MSRCTTPVSFSTETAALPRIIQGGMGAAVSSWRLARAVASAGQLGVVSGTALDLVFARRLQDGDPDGHLRRALRHFPDAGLADRVLRRYYQPHGRRPGQAYRAVPTYTVRPRPSLVELTVLANFAEVWLAREKHGGRVGINYLEKIQMPQLASLYGAMLAGVDFVLMGAGIPREIPGVLDGLAALEPVSLTLHVEGAASEDRFQMHLDPREVVRTRTLPALVRPRFLAIVASVTLAATLARKASGTVDGFVVEMPTAGGHNAPPRGELQLSARGEPVYGSRDEVDLARMAELGRPFWLAGSYGHPERLREALAAGAAGVQVGTAFAFCDESGIAPELKHRVLEQVAAGTVEVFTDPHASPTGFPFKVVRLDGTVSEPSVYAERDRMCDLGYLRQIYKKPDGSVGYRCPAEPLEAWIRKGGDPAATTERKCLCNGLMANVGMPQIRRSGFVEKPILTAGDDVATLRHFLRDGSDGYTAQSVLDYLLDALRAQRKPTK